MNDMLKYQFRFAFRALSGMLMGMHGEKLGAIFGCRIRHISSINSKRCEQQHLAENRATSFKRKGRLKRLELQQKTRPGGCRIADGGMILDYGCKSIQVSRS